MHGKIAVQKRKQPLLAQLGLVGQALPLEEVGEALRDLDLTRDVLDGSPSADRNTGALTDSGPPPMSRPFEQLPETSVIEQTPPVTKPGL